MLAGIRCGVIHRGDAAAHPHLGTSHVVFTLPGAGMAIHALTQTIEDQEAAMLDLPTFCQAMIDAAWRWFEEHKEHPMVIANLPNLLSLRPLGFPPFGAGEPVIAS